MSQTLEKPVDQEISQPEKSDLHKRLDRASEYHAQMHHEESVKDFFRFLDRKKSEKTPQ